MKISKAIELLSDPFLEHTMLPDPDMHDAIKLLIEAGKRLQETRLWHPAGTSHLLPGETEN